MFGCLSFLKSSIWISRTKIAVYQIRQNTLNSNSTLLSWASYFFEHILSSEKQDSVIIKLYFLSFRLTLFFKQKY